MSRRRKYELSKSVIPIKKWLGDKKENHVILGMYVDLKLGDKTYQFIVDTGASITLINSKVVPLKMLKTSTRIKEVSVNSFSGHKLKSNSMFKDIEVVIGGVPILMHKLPIYNIEDAIDGVLGIDCLKEMNAVIDIPKEQITINI